MILSWKYFFAWSVASARSTLERASTASAFVDVWNRSQRKIGVTLFSRPKDVALTATKFQALIGVKKGDPNNGFIRDSGAMAVLQTTTVSDVAVPSGSLVTPGPVVARSVLSSTMVRSGTLRTVSQSGLTFNVAGSIPRQTSQAKANTSPSSGVALAKDGVTYCSPQRTWVWGSGDVKQMRSRGRSVRGKVAIISSRDLGVVTCFSSRRVNSAGKALRPGSSLLDAPSAARLSDAACCVCRPKSSRGGRVGVVAPGGYVRAGACCCPWSRRGPPVYGLPEASWREATVDARAWMLARRSGVGASASMLASLVPFSSSS